MPIQYSQPAIFNVLDPWVDYLGVPATMVPGDPSKAPQNAAVLNGIIQLAQASNDQRRGQYYGAIIVIPGHDLLATVGGTGQDDGGIYFLQGPGDGTATIPIASNWPIKFLGTGSAKLVNHLPSTPGFVMGDLFSILTNGQYDAGGDMLGDNLGGMTFENLTFQFDSGNTQPGVAGVHTVTNVAYNGTGGAQNVRINGCVFIDCPIGVWFEQALQCSMFQCTFTYTPSNFGCTGLKIGGPNRATGTGTITGIFAKDIFITDCIFQVAQNTPTGGHVGLDLISAEHVRLKSVRFDAFDQGIFIRPGYAGAHTSPSGINVVRCFLTDVTVFVGQTATTGVAGTALTVQPQSASQLVGQLTFTGCTFEPGGDLSITTGAGVVVDANGSIIDTVRFVSCYSARWTGPGLSVGVSGHTGTVQNVEVLGGMYAGNNLSSGSQAYGIAIVGTASGVRVVGASCVGQYEYIQHNNQGSSPQQNIGIYIEGGVTNVLVDSCDVTLNAVNGIKVNASSTAVNGVLIRNCNARGITGGYSSAIYVTTTGTNASTVQVVGCAGYNDQSAPLTHSYPTGGLANFHGYDLGYYGPLEFYVLGAAVTINSIKVGTVTTGLLQGSFFLMPGEDAIVAFTPPTGTLTIPAIGK